MSEQGKGGVLENRAVIFSGGKNPNGEEKLLYLWGSVEGRNVVLSLIAGFMVRVVQSCLAIYFLLL